MVFSNSTAPDITEAIPASLTRAREASQTFSSSGAKFDVAIGGVPFFIVSSDEMPYRRETAPFQKNQIDMSREAGEHTLDGYWIRSQTSWHRGAGVRFYEPGSEAQTYYRTEASSAFRFEDSLGIDVWTKGKVTLLKKMVQGASVPAGECSVTGAVVGGADVYFTNENGTLKRRSDTNTVLATYTGVTDLVGRTALAGSKILAAHTTGIVVGDASGSSLAGLWTQAAGTTPSVYWAKSRIIATRGANVYDLTLAGGNLDTATPLYTHPDANWTWTSVSEGPSAIYAAGHSGGYSAIYRFFLQDATSGSVPMLSQAYQVSELPLGEEVHSIHVTLGAFMGVGTSRGMRVASIGSNGDLAMGSLLFEVTSPIKVLASGDRFIYGAVDNGHPDGKSGAFRVDLSEAVDANTNRFAYAWDARSTVNGTVTGLCLLGRTTRIVMAVSLSGVWVQSATDYEASGYLRTGRIRYDTVEQKIFRSLTIGSDVPNGTIAISAVDGSDNETYLRTIAPSATEGELSLGGLPGSYESLRFKFVLAVNAAAPAVTPVLDSMQCRALPFVRRQRLIQYPLKCMDREQSSTGVQIGSEGYGSTRLKALEAIEEGSVVVTIQDFRLNETYEGTIEQMTMMMRSPRSTDGRPNFGGYVTLTVRKL